MGWEIVVDGKADPRSFKDYAEFSAAIRAGITNGSIGPGADIKVRRRSPETDQASDDEPGPVRVVPVFTYERHALTHNQVMSGAVAIGAIIAWFARGLMGI